MDLRGEPQLAADLGPEEGLLSGAIAREHEDAPLVVPDREPEHAFEALYGGGAEALVEGDDVLDVAPRAERIPPARGFLPQLAGVVNLAVAHHPDGAVGALERLVARGQVHDGEPPRPQLRALMADDALAVRAAVRERRGHRVQAVGVPQRLPVEGDGAEDAAHYLTP